MKGFCPAWGPCVINSASPLWPDAFTHSTVLADTVRVNVHQAALPAKELLRSTLSLLVTEVSTRAARLVRLSAADTRSVPSLLTSVRSPVNASALLRAARSSIDESCDPVGTPLSTVTVISTHMPVRPVSGKGDRICLPPPAPLLRRPIITSIRDPDRAARFSCDRPASSRRVRRPPVSVLLALLIIPTASDV